MFDAQALDAGCDTGGDAGFDVGAEADAATLPPRATGMSAAAAMAACSRLRRPLLRYQFTVGVLSYGRDSSARPTVGHETAGVTT
jgi:hypothetical protein